MKERLEGWKHYKIDYRKSVRYIGPQNATVSGLGENKRRKAGKNTRPAREGGAPKADGERHDWWTKERSKENKDGHRTKEPQRARELRRPKKSPSDKEGKMETQHTSKRQKQTKDQTKKKQESHNGETAENEQGKQIIETNQRENGKKSSAGQPNEMHWKALEGEEK